MLLKGKITISRTPSGHINIELIDNDTYIQVAKVELTLEQYALAITNMGHVDCDINYNYSSDIGRKREHCTRPIPVCPDEELSIMFRTNDDLLRSYIFGCDKEMREGGWEPRVYDYGNYNKKTGDSFNIVFERFADKETE